MSQRGFKIRLSILVLAAVTILVLWIRSRKYVEYVQWTDGRHIPGVASSQGRVIYSYQFFLGGAGGNDPGWSIGSWDGVYWPPPRKGDFNTWPDSRNYLLGFEWSPKAGGRMNNNQFLALPAPTIFVVAVPHWFLFGLVILLAWWVYRRRPRRKGLCRNCGYDLRATVDRCPECGTAIATGDRRPEVSN